MLRYKIKSNISEDQIEADVAHYLGWITPDGRAPFRLSAVNEQVTGADKKFDLLFPLYLQFKVSEGLMPLQIPIYFSLSKTDLYRIRNFRAKRNLFDNPTLYFKLRDLAQNARDYQHNVLLALANTGFSEAFYVAPLTTDIDEYTKLLYDTSNRYLSSPFNYGNIAIHQQDWVSYIGFVPFLRAHVSIVPHERVDTSDHYYSYSTSGSDLAWHSKGRKIDASRRLSDRLTSVIRYRLYNKQSWLSFERLVDNLRDLRYLRELRFTDAWFDNDRTPIENIMEFGRTLFQVYGIRQVLLLTNLKTLDAIANNESNLST
jgi:hypothetical protein